VLDAAKLAEKGGVGSVSEGASAGQILVGIFLILFGLCITLVGGGCTLMWIAFSLHDHSSDAALLFLVSLATLAGGLVTVWAGVKMLRSK
jgi:hypothetical protein